MPSGATMLRLGWCVASVAVTLLAYWASCGVHTRFPSALTNPVFLAAAGVMLVLAIPGLDSHFRPARCRTAGRAVGARDGGAGRTSLQAPSDRDCVLLACNYRTGVRRAGNPFRRRVSGSEFGASPQSWFGPSVSSRSPGVCWVAEIRNGCVVLFDAATFFHFHAGALRFSNGRHAAVLRSAAPLTQDVLENLERLHQRYAAADAKIWHALVTVIESFKHCLRVSMSRIRGQASKRMAPFICVPERRQLRSHFVEAIKE